MENGLGGMKWKLIITCEAVVIIQMRDEWISDQPGGSRGGENE